MILASATDLGRQYAGDPIFTGLRFEVRAGERIGLVGTNGAGKTTLLRLLARLDPADYGHLHLRPGIRVSLLKQQPDFDPSTSLIEVARSGLASIVDLQDELEEAARELAEAEDDDDRARASRRFAAIQDQIEHQDVYTIEHRVEEVLAGLGFRNEDFQRAAGTFSGGQQSRLMLAKLLLESPDLMLLDEPSNHLDIATTEWLEAYLSRQPVAMVVVSHDRYFLDAVVTKLWELHDGHLTPYPGNYTQYWRLREERAKVLERQAEKQAAEVADLKDFIARNAAGQKSKQAKDREKKLERIESVETMSVIEGPVMGFGEVDRAGDIVIEARKVSKAFDPARPLFRDLDLAIERERCVGILGPNGAGKTTLLKILIGQMKPDAGEVKLGHRVQVGYYDQGLEALPPETPLLRAVRPEDDATWVDQDTRDLLARFGLSGDVVFQKVGQLSGGERGKAALARLAATCANVLVMDEPTNHLDLWSCASLERSIREFEGTVLVVSHDRFFLNQVADRIIVVADGRARVIEGDYETYRRLDESARQEAAQAAARAQARAAINEPAKSTTDEGAPGAKRRRKFPYRKPADVERDIEKTEAELAELEASLMRPETYRDPDNAREVRARHDDTRSRLTALYEHWEEALELNS
jgi:ATP-binding cassette subfamily F protein 3